MAPTGCKAPVEPIEFPPATFPGQFAATCPAGRYSLKGTIEVMAYLLVFLGAGLGGALRHGVNVAVARLLLPGFPVATLTVNVMGSIIMGLLVGYFAFRGDASQHWRLFLTTGVLGGFTTFSTFSLDIALLWERGQTLGAFLYVLASLVLAVGGLFAGLNLMRQMM